jgi:hypothetical protein
VRLAGFRVAAPAVTLPPPCGGPGGAPRAGRAGFGALIAAGALAAGGGLFLWSSWSRYNDATHCAAASDRACDEAADAIKTRNWTSRILFGGAALAAIAGGTLVYLHPVAEPGGRSAARGWMAGAVRTF